MKEMTLFFVDDFLNIVYKDRVIQNKLKDIISKGYIVDRSRFVEEFLKIIKKEKIKVKLFGDNINIVCNSYFSSSYIFFLETIFLDFGFIHVNFVDIKDLLPESNATYIEINEEYMVINLDKGVYLDLEYFKDIPQILEYFKAYFKEDVVLFGTNKNIAQIKMKNKFLYHLENSATYINDSLLKVKKYGA